jgi:uncharacterized protein YecE (DUF72 family)
MGPPKVYDLTYSPDEVEVTVQHLRTASSDTTDRWYIFDNIALREATGQAPDLS